MFTSAESGNPLLSPESLFAFAMKVFTSTGVVATCVQNLFENMIVESYVHKCYVGQNPSIWSPKEERKGLVAATRGQCDARAGPMGPSCGVTPR
eukprot:3213507-Karenia_brevis.AAC.1